MDFLEFVSNYIDQGHPVDVIYQDFHKAFDKVPHRRLLLKIKSFGIAGNVYKWIEDWLKDREQKVVILCCNSEWIKVKSGVLCWVPFCLCMIYINDIDDICGQFEIIKIC